MFMGFVFIFILFYKNVESFLFLYKNEFFVNTLSFYYIMYFFLYCLIISYL